LPSELSGGQQQRVALARALVLEPAVLLFDEPLSNLDARLRREMREEIRSLQQRLKLTVAYVTHDQSEALAVSDQIIVMDHGVIAQRGTPEQLYSRPESEFVAGFMGEAMVFPATAQADGSVTLGPLRVQPRYALAPGSVKVAVRPGGLADRRRRRPVRPRCARRRTSAASTNTASTPPWGRSSWCRPTWPGRWPRARRPRCRWEPMA
jgi:iron(III) transport system ATP-binding protein